MYLPTLLVPQYTILHEYILRAGNSGNGDRYTIIVRWVSHTWAVLLAWLKKASTATMNWINDALPVVAAWMTEALQPLKAHPHIALIVSASIFLGPQILLLPLFILQAVFFLLLAVIGFGAGGIVGGSPAARYQSMCYGGNTPASSLFAILQSIGTKYHAVTLGNWVLAIVRLGAGLVFVYVLLGITWLW
ncbi:hypothetical protein DFH06DRAFT_767353 [Mycena polygramma]|nr:hypothetical protein DFH06DRAFT_767353 [Mycena polygramma]